MSDSPDTGKIPSSPVPPARGYRRVKSIVQQIFIISIITFVLCEVCLNVWLYRIADEANFEKYALFEEILAKKPMRYEPHPYMSYVTKANFEKGKTRHDARGFRGPRRSAPKKEGVFRVVVIGGSTTYTEFVENDRDTFPARLEKSLRKLGYKTVEVVNGGVPGFTSFESLANLQYRVLDIEPDLVVNYDCLNDAHTRFVNPRSYRGDNTAYRKAWSISVPAIPWYEQSTFIRVVRRLIGISPPETDLDRHAIHGSSKRWRKLPEGEALEVLEQNPPIYFRRNLESMIAICRARGIGIMFATFAYNPRQKSYMAKRAYQRAIAEQNSVLRKMGRDSHVPVYNFSAEMPGASCPECWLDGRHVSAKGARLQGEYFARFIHEQHLIPASFIQTPQ